MTPRANWKGFLKVGELTCPVSLFTAVSTSERIAFHIINRNTGHRVRRQFVDEETGRAVEASEQVKGYEVSRGEYIVLEPEEVASVIPESDKTIGIEAFIPCEELDEVYFDRPYYLAPSNPMAEEAFAALREGMRAGKVAAVGRAVLFRRLRTLLIQAHGAGMIATTLNFDYEVRSAEEAFHEIPLIESKGEMLDLAKYIIETKSGRFDPKTFDDRYENALAEIVKAKLEGRSIRAPKKKSAAKVADLMEALRESAKAAGGGAPSPAAPGRGKRTKQKTVRKAATKAKLRRKAG